jgi:hypothetical protein
MANYLLLYHGGGMPETDEEKAKVTAAWNDWMGELADKLVDAGNPTSKAETVSQDGASDLSGERVSGYSVIKAGSLDEALTLAKAVPVVAAGGSVDVYETFNAM